MKPVLAMLAYGGLKPETTRSMVGELTHSGMDWTLKLAGDDAAVDRTRGKLCTELLQSANDVLVMVDHDIGWRPGDAEYIAKLACEHRGVVGGLVSKRAFGNGFGGRFGDGKPHEFGTDELVKLDQGFVGGAFVAIHRYVLEVLSEVVPMVTQGFHPFFTPAVVFDKDKKVHEYLSEDWTFCSRCHRYGLPVFVSMRPMTSHWGEFGYTVFTATGGPR